MRLLCSRTGRHCRPAFLIAAAMFAVACGGDGSTSATSSTASPTDAVALACWPDLCAGVVCGAPPNECYKEGICNPVDGLCLFFPKAVGTPCTDDGLGCSLDVCGWSATCVHVTASAGTLCRPAAGPCDVAETCNGVSKLCPSDVGGVCTYTLCGHKYYDANASGTRDPGEVGLAGWDIAFMQPLTTATTGTSLAGEFRFEGLAPGEYRVCEYGPLEGTWMQTAPAEGCYTVQVPSDAASSCTLDFGNLCLGAGGGLTPGFWSNSIGEIAFMGADNGAGALELLRSLNLRTAVGGAFDPFDYAEVRTWLVARDAVNMAYILSTHLAAMELNVLRGFVWGEALIFAPSVPSASSLGFVSITGLLAEADHELGINGYAPSGSDPRAYQEILKDAIDSANNDTSFVQAEACEH